MSQTETTLIQQTSMEEPKVVVSSSQVAPQLEEEGEREKAEKGSKINPEYVKSPITEPAATTNRANSTKSKSSLKPFQKAGSFLDNSDKSSSSLVKKNNNNVATTSRTSQQTATTTATTEVPPIITNQTELENLSSSNNTHNKIPTPTTTDNINKETETTAILSTSPTTQLSPGPEVWLLPPLATEDKEKKCLVLDLDETLVHSSFKMIPNPDFIVPVEIDNQYHNVYVLKRPGVDEFMRKMGEIYEIVVFTASLAKYADPVLDMLDIHRVVKHRLFRESCFNHKGTYVKDLSQLGRDLTSTLILDNSPASYIFHTSNAVPVSTWFNDPHDTELTDLIAFLEDLTMVDDVQLILNTAIDTVIPST